jgi:MFS family permease
VKRLLHVRESSIWRHRDLRLMLPARAVSTFGDTMTLLVLTLRLYDDGRGPWAITALLLCAAVPTVVLAPAAGRLVDTVPFRTLAVATALWQAACCTALAFASPVWATLGLVLALQAGHVVAGPAWTALVPAIAPRDEVGRVVGASQALNTLASVAAPAAAGLAVGRLGHAAPLLLDAATFVLLAAAALALRTRRERAPVVQGGGAAAPEGAFSLRSDPVLRPLLLGLCALVLSGEVTNVVEVFLLRGELGAGSTAFGLVAAVLAAGLVAGSVAAGRGAPSDAARATRAGVAALVLSLGLVAAGMAPTVVAFALAWGLVGAANGVVNTDTGTLLLTRTPEAARGRALANVNAMLRGSALGAMALGGAAGTLLGARPTFVVAGAVSVAVAGVVLVRLRAALAGAGTVPLTSRLG